jgi:alpha-ketoglutarate-dependent taurine dioxygenase
VPLLLLLPLPLQAAAAAETHQQLAMRLEPLPDLPFGCAVHDLQLADGVSDAEFAQLEQAFHAHGVVILRGQAAPHPRDEVALARRLERLWCDTPAIIEERDPNAANLRGCNPPGFPEVAVLGNGEVSDHFGLAGAISVQGPLNWHEEASLGWHPDGAYDGREENVLTLFSCYASPSDSAEAAPTGTVSWPRPPVSAAAAAAQTQAAAAGGGEPQQQEEADQTARLQFPAGSTVFASLTHAFDLCSPAEQDLLRSLQVRYYEAPTAMARRVRDIYPIMDPAGIRPLYPPPGPVRDGGEMLLLLPLSFCFCSTCIPALCGKTHTHHRTF